MKRPITALHVAEIPARIQPSGIRHRILVGGMALIGLCVQAQQVCSTYMPRQRPDSRYESVAGALPPNSEIRDKVTQLIWQRCVVGMVWNNTSQTCELISPNTFPTVSKWTDALELARTAPSSAVPGASAWRLPNHAEAYSLPDRACFGPALNTSWFPADPAGWFWTASPNRASTTSAWIVNTYNGEDFVNSKESRFFVRLVR